MEKSVTLKDVLGVLNQDGPINIRVRMAEILLKELMVQNEPTDEDCLADMGPCGK